MNLRISSGELYRMLQVGLNAIPSKPVYPILADFLFTVEGDKLTITSTDLDFTIVTETTIVPSENGKFAFPGDILVSTLRELPEQPIELVYDEETSGLSLISAYGTYKSSSNNVEDYPNIKEISVESQVIIPANRLIKALNTCVFAAATDEMKTNMLGLSVTIQPDSIVAAATDAHKLVKYTLFHENGDHEASFVIPKKVVSILKHIANDDLPITISYERNQILFAYKNYKVYCKLIDQKFPNYNAVIPLNNDKEIIINRLELLQSLKRITVYGNRTTYQTSFHVAENEMKIDTLDADFSNEAKEVLKCQYTNDPLELTYNAKYLIDSLSNLDAQEVRLALSQPSRAAILTPKEDEIGENILMLVMPVMTKRSIED